MRGCLMITPLTTAAAKASIDRPTAIKITENKSTLQVHVARGIIIWLTF
jgi:hypothetical protein